MALGDLPAPPGESSEPASSVGATTVRTPAASAAESPRRLRLTLSAGYDYGFTDLLSVTYEGGGKDRLGANGGFTLAVGGAWRFDPSSPWELRFDLGVKYDWVTGSNGSASYSAFPIEVLVARNLAPLRVAAGFSLALDPTVHGSGFLAPANVELRSSLGLVGQVDWVLVSRPEGPSFSVGVRGIWQRLEVSTGGNSIDASAVGFVVGSTL
jgi:hypothetical protein